MEAKERKPSLPKEEIHILKQPLSQDALASRTHSGYMKKLIEAREKEKISDTSGQIKP